MVTTDHLVVDENLWIISGFLHYNCGNMRPYLVNLRGQEEHGRPVERDHGEGEEGGSLDGVVDHRVDLAQRGVCQGEGPGGGVVVRK